MDRGNFLFSGAKGNKDAKQKELMSKIQQDKELLKINKEQGEKAFLV